MDDRRKTKALGDEPLNFHGTRRRSVSRHRRSRHRAFHLVSTSALPLENEDHSTYTNNPEYLIIDHESCLTVRASS